jgi:hypothetical protein
MIRWSVFHVYREHRAVIEITPIIDAFGLPGFGVFPDYNNRIAAVDSDCDAVA